MPPRRRQFAVACALLLAVHAGSFGLLWTNATPPVPDGRQVGPGANATALLAAAAHNEGTFASTTEVRLAYPSNGSTAVRFRFREDPAAGRFHARTVEDVQHPNAGAAEVYRTSWGEWWREGDRWRYETGYDHRYRPGTARLVRPAVSADETVQKTVNDDGTVTVRLTGAWSTGMLLFARDNATITYRIDFRDGRPYVASAHAVPGSDDGLAVTVNRTLGATVDRPDGLPPVTPRELVARLGAGVRNA